LWARTLDDNPIRTWAETLNKDRTMGSAVVCRLPADSITIVWAARQLPCIYLSLTTELRVCVAVCRLLCGSARTPMAWMCSTTPLARWRDTSLTDTRRSSLLTGRHVSSHQTGERAAHVDRHSAQQHSSWYVMLGSFRQVCCSVRLAVGNQRSERPARKHLGCQGCWRVQRLQMCACAFLNRHVFYCCCCCRLQARA
jgi:hypothetical protein